MRTVLSPETLAFEAGYQAYRDGKERNENPYENSPQHTAWFDGWDRGLEVSR